MKKSLDTRKTLLALAVIFLSFGALGWQIMDYQRKQAEAQILFSEAPTLEWRAATAKERDAALSSIKNQLDAFKSNDSVTATKYQSKNLRANFRSPQEFGAMIKKGYPQFASYKSVTFGSAQIDKSGKYFQVPVTVTGTDGVKADAHYMMIFEEGLWRVSGVDGGIKRQPKPRQKSATGLQT